MIFASTLRHRRYRLLCGASVRALAWATRADV